MSVIEDRLARFTEIDLESGGHKPDSRFCVMEAVAYVAGEPWSDSPECVSPVIAAFLRFWNDSLSDEDRQMLKPLIPKVIGTKASARVEEKRAWMATDWLARECAPAFLRVAGLTEQAEALEGLAALTTEKRAEKARPALSAADSAARSAARSAALSAARSAALSAADSAAYSAALSAARSAALSAADSALEPTVKALQKSALLLVERMCEVK